MLFRSIDNIRLWDWRALQDTLRQIQEIRTYYDFRDVDIDRYTINGKLRQMMLGQAIIRTAPEALLPRAQALAASFVNASPMAVSLIKRALAAPSAGQARHRGLGVRVRLRRGRRGCRG